MTAMTTSAPRPPLRHAVSAPRTGAADESQRLSWRSPAPGLWVAETATAYLGMVDRNHDGFVATSATGADLGVFPTRAKAQLAVYSEWFRSVTSGPMNGLALPLAAATAAAVGISALISESSAVMGRA